MSRNASMHPEMLRVELGDRSYPIWIGSRLLRDATLLQPHLARGVVGVVTNTTVASLWLEPLRAALGGRLGFVEVLPDGEEHKTLATAGRLYDALAAARLGRDGTLIALGGGVVGDITGFVAATWQRGVDFVQVPTTLLAQVDSSVGGKTGVNHPRGKNLIGAFHQPRCVLADVDTLATLPERELAAGLAEVLKYGLLGDPDFYLWVRENAAALRARDAAALAVAVRRSCIAKAAIVAEDEREGEGGSRALLNLGHTFGHALETVCGYGVLLHGEAVGIGMLMAAELSCRLGWIDERDVAGLRALLGALGLPASVPPGVEATALRDAMLGDKKTAAGRIRLVLLRGIGHAVLSAEFPDGELRAVLAGACAAGGRAA
jgi:3-dehydroquinate synthase